jgi:hypothetical protein
VEAAVAREAGDRHLGAVGKLLDQAEPAAGSPQRGLHRLAQLLLGAHEREPATRLSIGRLHHAGEAELVVRIGHDLPAGLRNAFLLEPLPLTKLRAREHRRRRRDRVREAVARCDARSGTDGQFAPRGDHSVDALGLGEALQRGLVVERDDGSPIGEAEAGRRGIAVDGDHEQIARAGRSQQAELPRARP